MVLMKLKWNKATIDDLEVNGSITVDQLKESIYRLTNVPKDRQKLMCKGAWTAILKDTQDLSQCKLEDGMQIMLMGTADTVQAPSQAIKFVEEMNSSEKAVIGTIFPPGLNNLGNTCYMNSVIHCIRWIPQVKEALQQVRSANPVIATLSGLIRSLETTGVTVTPLEFVTAIRGTFPAFAERSNSGGYVQQDAEEFYSALNSELGREERIRHIYNDAMEISLEEKLECLESTAEPPTVRTDKMFKLICNIQGGAGAAVNIDYMRDGIRLGLQTNIEKFSESLQRNAQYKKTLTIANLPKCICVQFMRFFWKPTPESRDHTGVKCKVLRNVAFHDVSYIHMFDF
jgi:ubiquitin carboxyl-terminal hydrolase 14